MKKIFSLFLTVALCLSMYMSAFAADSSDGNSEIPEGIKKTTITYEMEADNGIQPLMWDVEERETSKQSAWTPIFTIPDRYFGYEISATSGNPYGEFNVALMDSYNTVVCSKTNLANGTVKKEDWITVHAGTNHQFLVSNLTGSYLKFKITYYSWK